MPAAVAIPAIIGAAGSVTSGIIGSHAAGSAANTQAQAAQQIATLAQAAGGRAGDLAQQAAGRAATGVQVGATNASAGVSNATNTSNTLLGAVLGGEYANLSPYLGLGTQATNTLAQAIAPGGDLTKQFSFDPTQIANDPGYQFQQQQGLEALNRMAAAKGQSLSGGTLLSATKYASGLAATSVNDAYARALNTFQTNRNNLLGQLTGSIGIGQNATNQFQGAAQNFGNQAGANTLNAAVYGGNAGMNAAQFSGNADINSAQYAGTTGLDATRIAAEALAGGANAQAAGKVGAANAWTGALSGVTNAAQLAALTGGFGGGYMVPGLSASPTITATTDYANNVALPSVLPSLPSVMPPPMSLGQAVAGTYQPNRGGF